MQTPNHDAIAPHKDAHSTFADAGRVILIERIDNILPQTQCQQCGYDGCKPYAVAIVQGDANINQCPPGGEVGIRALANLLNVPYLPLNTAHGMTKPKAIAMIDEQHCIGCTLCIKACPVDAILGASKQMHTVISQECTGCELCLAPCPVDCIIMQPATHIADNTQADCLETKAAANLARQRYQHRQERLALEKQQRTQTYAKRHQSLASAAEKVSTNQASSTPNTNAIKKAAIAAAMARVKAQKEKSTNNA